MPGILLVKVYLLQRKMSLRYMSRNKTHCINQIHMSKVVGEEVMDNFSDSFHGSWSFTPLTWKSKAWQALSLLDHSWRAPLLLCSWILCCCTTPLALEVLCIFSPFCWVHAVLFAGSWFGSCLLGATVKGLKIHLFSGRRGIVVSNFLPRQHESLHSLTLTSHPPHHMCTHISQENIPAPLQHGRIIVNPLSLSHIPSYAPPAWSAPSPWCFLVP